jgi:D-sedoheptulose 7-phosphate isomerase
MAILRRYRNRHARAGIPPLIQGFSSTYLTRLQAVLAALDPAAIDTAITLIADTWATGRQVITLGNGGSAMTALHFINDWNKGVFAATGKAFRGRSLCDNIGLITAYANDVSYQDVFIEQLRNVMEAGDLVLAISGSGNSENVIRAVDHANRHGGVTLGLCGFRGGRLKAAARHSVWVDIDDMQIVEDVHAIFGHIVMQALCD